MIDINLIFYSIVQAFMDVETTTLIIGTIIGMIVGIVVIYAIMQSRVSKNIQRTATSMFDQQKEQLELTFRQQAKSEFDKHVAEYEIKVQQRIEEARKESLDRSRTSLKGKIGEQMAPLLPEFITNYEPADARFIGTPIDYIIFKNMSKNSSEIKEPLEIIMLEVKSGNSSLTKIEKAVKDAIGNQRVRFETLKIQTDTSEPNTP